jgi:hypothetical protein
MAERKELLSQLERIIEKGNQNYNTSLRKVLEIFRYESNSANGSYARNATERARLRNKRQAHLSQPLHAPALYAMEKRYWRDRLLTQTMYSV